MEHSRVSPGDQSRATADKSIAKKLAQCYFLSMKLPSLSRREREIMEVLYGGEGLTAAEVRDRMEEPAGYSAVRALLRILEEKGHVRHEQQGPRYVFWPVVPRAKAGRSALKALVETFFGGSPEEAVAALIDTSGPSLTPHELDRLADLIEAARKKEEP